MRQTPLGEALVALADTLVDDYDILDSLYMMSDRCTQVLDVDAAGVLLVGEDGVLELCAASSEDMRLLELFELQQREGPCQDAYHRGEQVVVTDLTTTHERWPRFTPRALDMGFHAVYAFPLRLRGDRIGALNTFRRAGGSLGAEDLRAGQTMADVATIGIMQERALREARDRTHHLQRALDRRVVIEQAKGMVAQRLQLDVGEAFELIRQHARSDNRTVLSVSQAVINGRIGFD